MMFETDLRCIAFDVGSKLRHSGGAMNRGWIHRSGSLIMLQTRAFRDGTHNATWVFIEQMGSAYAKPRLFQDSEFSNIANLLISGSVKKATSPFMAFEADQINEGLRLVDVFVCPAFV